MASRSTRAQTSPTGRLAAVVLEAESRHRVVRLVLSAYRGTLRGRRNVTVAPAREAIITTPVPMVCDSEVLGDDDRVGPGGAGNAVNRGVSRLARTSLAFLVAFGLAEVGVGLARAATTTYVPVLLDRISDSPALIGAVMLVNAAAGFAVPLAVGVWSDRRPGRLGRRTPFVVGGVAITSAGLLAVAAGADTSYPILGLAAGVRVRRPERDRDRAPRALSSSGSRTAADPRRPARRSLRCSSAGCWASGCGGVLIGDTPAWLLFVVAAVVAPLLARADGHAAPPDGAAARCAPRARRRHRTRPCAPRCGARVRARSCSPRSVGGGLRRAAGLLRALRRSRSRSQRGRRRRHARRVRHPDRRRDGRGRARAAGARLPAAPRSAPRCSAAVSWPRPRRARLAARGAPVRVGGGRCRTGHRARLPVLRALRAEGGGGQLQRALLLRRARSRPRSPCRSPGCWSSSPAPTAR